LSFACNSSYAWISDGSAIPTSKPRASCKQHDGAVAARQGLGQQFHHVAVDARLLQVDERHLQMIRQEIMER
jgi:hypothetical protein